MTTAKQKRGFRRLWALLRMRQPAKVSTEPKVAIESAPLVPRFRSDAWVREAGLLEGNEDAFNAKGLHAIERVVAEMPPHPDVRFVRRLVKTARKANQRHHVLQGELSSLREDVLELQSAKERAQAKARAIVAEKQAEWKAAKDAIEMDWAATITHHREYVQQLRDRIALYLDALCERDKVIGLLRDFVLYSESAATLAAALKTMIDGLDPARTEPITVDERLREEEKKAAPAVEAGQGA